MQIPGYDIHHQLGKGGMATVYLAVQQSLHRQVALKIMSASLAANEEFTPRFIKEGQIIGRLSHPNIVTVFDIGVQDFHHYLSMEYLPGGTLKEHIRAGEVSTERALAVARAVAEALGHAHQRGVIHRDIKPNNVLFRQDGTPVLTDFGVAKDLESSTQLTVTGITIGSINYMSPEQFRGGQLDARSDLYGLGVLLWEALTGELPYHAASNDPFAIALKHANDPVPALPEALGRYQGLIDGLMAKDPVNRFATTEDFIRTLDALERQDADIHTESTELIPDTAATAKYAAEQRHRDTGAGHRWLPALVVTALLAGGGYLSLPLLPQPGSGDDPGSPPATGTDSPPQSTATAATATTSELEPGAPPTVEDLLGKAERLLQAERYDPDKTGDNAFDTYRRVLELEPGNEAARQGLLAISQLRLGNRYRDMAQSELDAGNLQASLEQIRKGLRLAPRHPGLLALQETVQTRLDDTPP